MCRGVSGTDDLSLPQLDAECYRGRLLSPVASENRPYIVFPFSIIFRLLTHTVVIKLFHMFS